ncbi:citrate transporter [Clostridium butyricum]|uniref:citrate transporter n=1 Tax=Clostridium butyricum TaxID=1492 RepID=UPI0032C0165D
MSVEFIIGILLLVSFAGLVAYAVKGGNLMTGILIMAIIWTVLPLIGNALVTNPDFIAQNSDIVNMSIVDALKKVFQGGPEGWGGVLINFIFGAWFGRIMLETGIAATIIRKTVELGGDKPIVTSTLLAIVTTAVFSSMFGAGAVVAIGVIVLPILLSLGIPKLLATVSFLLSIGAGLYINPVIFNQYQAFYLGANGEKTYFYNGGYLKWGFVALAVQLIVAILIPAILMKKQKRVHAWAAQAPQTEEVKAAPVIALLTPFIPVVLAIGFNVPVIVGFLVASFFALAVCGKLTSYKAASEVFNKTFYDGAIDTAPLVGFMLMIPMFNKAAELCVPYFNAVLGGLIPNNTLVICVAFAVLAPLGMFRGPFTLAGCGAATLGILKSVGFATPLLFPLMYAPTVTMNISSCITQSWIVWGLGYTKVDTKDFLKLSIPAGWLICAILSLITYIMFGM